MVWLSDRENSLITRFDRIHERDRQQDKRTDGQTDTARQHMCSIARQRSLSLNCESTHGQHHLEPVSE